MIGLLPFAGIGPYGAYGNRGLYGALVTYASQTLTESSPPQSFTEPLDLDTVKAYLKISARSPADSAEDALIEMLISAARATVEREQERELIQRQWDLRFDYWPSNRIEIGKPLLSVDLMEYIDSNGQVWPMILNQDFLVDTNKQPGVITPPYNRTWPSFTPWPSSSILIRATTGYPANHAWWEGEIGRQVRLGMLILASEWFNNRLPYDTPVTGYPYPLQILINGGGLVRAR